MLSQRECGSAIVAGLSGNQFGSGVRGRGGSRGGSRGGRLTCDALRQHIAANGGDMRQGGARSEGAASAATMFGVASMEDAVNEVAEKYGDMLRGSKSVEGFMVALTVGLVLHLMPSVWRALENVQGIMRRGDFNKAIGAFVLSTQRSNTVKFTNRTTVRQIGGTPLWRTLCSFLKNDLKGCDAFWAYVFTLVFSLNCNLERAIEMLQGKVDLNNDPFILRVGRGIKNAMKSSKKLTPELLVGLFTGGDDGAADGRIDVSALLVEVSKQAAAASAEVDDELGADDAQLMKLDVIALFVRKLREKVLKASVLDMRAGSEQVVEALANPSSEISQRLRMTVGGGNMQPLQDFMQRQSNTDARLQMFKLFTSAMLMNNLPFFREFIQSNLDGNQVIQANDSRVQELVDGDE